MSKNYKIIRFFEKHPRKVIKSGITLKEAKAHCNSKQSSSDTATGTEALMVTKNFGAWFDGWTEI
jgi:hypothetical protein